MNILMKMVIILVRIGDTKMKTELSLDFCYCFCPECDNENVHGHGLVITENDTATQIVSCDKCNYMWVEVYTFHHNIELEQEKK